MLKSRQPPADNAGVMRSLALALLLLSGLFFLPSAGPMPRGTEEFTLGMPRVELEALLAKRGIDRISESNGVLATETDRAGAEFERYAFVRSPRDNVMVLWQAVTGYDFPTDLAEFDRVATGVERWLGPATETRGEFDRNGDPVGLHEKLWAGGDFTVQLGARWSEQPDPRTDRMLLTWTDLRLSRIAKAYVARSKAARAGK